MVDLILPIIRCSVSLYTSIYSVANRVGIWWSMYDVYSEETLNSEVLQGYADHDLPLEVMSFDMDWHNTYVPEGCNGWGNFGKLTIDCSIKPHVLLFITYLRCG